MDLKRGIDAAVEAIVASLKSRCRKISSQQEIAQVATIAANGDKETGEKIAEAMTKVGHEGVITVEEAKGLAFEMDIVKEVEAYTIKYFEEKVSSLLFYHSIEHTRLVANVSATIADASILRAREIVALQIADCLLLSSKSVWKTASSGLFCSAYVVTRRITFTASCE